MSSQHKVRTVVRDTYLVSSIKNMPTCYQFITQIFLFAIAAKKRLHASFLSGHPVERFQHNQVAVTCFNCTE